WDAFQLLHRHPETARPPPRARAAQPHHQRRARAELLPARLAPREALEHQEDGLDLVRGRNAQRHFPQGIHRRHRKRARHPPEHRRGGRLLMRRLAFTALTLAAALAAACLPNDTRPEPAEIEFTASSSDATRQGLTTVDGYDISFERALIDVGQGYVG